MRAPVASAVALAAACALSAGCGAPECEPSPVRLPAAADAMEWLDPTLPIVEAKVEGRPLGLLVDTGFSQTALTPGAAQGLDPSRLELTLGATQVGPAVAGLLMVDVGVDGVLGAESLHQIPHVYDARARMVEFRPAFEAPSPGAGTMTVIAPRACRGDSVANGPRGPFAFLVDADVEGTPATFLLDTGAQATFVRESIRTKLTDRATVSGIRIGSGFSGDILGTATRARTLTVGDAEGPNQIVISAPEVDAELDRLSALFSSALPEGAAAIRVDGFLGWTFLREFEVSLAQGASPTDGRTLALTRFDSQDHWSREFRGAGVYRAPSTDPPGIAIVGFLDPSPAKEAGVQIGDVIVRIDGVPVDGDDPMVFNGPTAQWELRRGSETLTLTVPWEDLLPDPPQAGP